MGSGPVCKCGKREAWVVTADHCNHSAFNGYRSTASDYSEVYCSRDRGGCGVSWRTKAAYVDELPLAKYGDFYG